MSVTFHIEGSPYHVESFECQCVENGKRWDLCTMCGPNGRVGYTVDDWGSVNVANMTCQAMFRCMGLDFEPGGEWPLDQIPDVRHRIISVLNRHDGTLRGEEDPIEEDRYHFGGISAEQLQHRFQELLALLVTAQTQGCALVWG